MRKDEVEVIIEDLTEKVDWMWDVENGFLILCKDVLILMTDKTYKLVLDNQKVIVTDRNEIFITKGKGTSNVI